MYDFAGVFPEFGVLFWSVALFAIYLFVQSGISIAQNGLSYSVSPRDTQQPESVYAGRADRALKNFVQTWPAFIILVLVAQVTSRADELTFWGAQLWFWARLAYLPLYLLGIPYIRSLAWGISILGLVLMFVGILF